MHIPSSRVLHTETVLTLAVCSSFYSDWNQLGDHQLLPGGVLEPVVPEAVEAGLVPQVQLCAVRGAGRRHTGDHLHPDFCALWSKRQVGAVPELLGQQRERESGLLQG